jgi:hypothetical protein
MNASFNVDVCKRLPLAEASLRLLDFALDKQMLETVYTHHRGTSFERVISFPVCVRLMADCLLGHHGSAHRTFQAAIDENDNSLDVSVQAMYGKLRRLPIGLSLATFDAASARLRSIGTFVDNPLPASLKNLWVLGFDGKKLKYVAHKLKPLRRLKGNIFGSKLLAVQDLATKQAVAVEAHEDGEASDVPLVPAAVARVRALADARQRLWVGDRGFCDFASLELLSSENDHFVIRHNAACKFTVDERVPKREGQDDEKRAYREEWGWLGKDRVRVRKITVTRPTGDPFTIITSLLDADGYPAEDLLLLYRERWGLETMFQQIVQTFNLRHLISAAPRATVFQAVLSLLLYNITLMVRDIVASQAKQEAKDVSLFLLFDELVAQLTSWLHMMDVAETLEILGTMPIDGAEAVRAHLGKILANVWKKRWKKAPKPKNKRTKKRKDWAYPLGGHTSVYKVLRNEHREVPLKRSHENGQAAPEARPSTAKENV